MKKQNKRGQAVDDLITQAEAAALRGVSVSAINHLIRRGRLSTVERYGLQLVSKSEVLSFERERKGWPKGKSRKAGSKK